MANKTEKMAGALQENILALVCTNEDHCQIVRQSIPLKLYSNEIFRTIASKAYDFIDAHGQPPNEHLPDLLEEYIDDSREGRLYGELMHGLILLGKTLNIKYVINQLTVFVQESSLRLGIVEAAELLQQDDFDGARGLIEAALTQSAPVFSPGITMLDLLAKLRRGEQIRDVFPCGIHHLDIFDLGPARGELWMLVGGVKRGKSWGLIHLARSAIISRARVLYVTLEVSEEIIAQRIVQAFCGYYARKPHDRDDVDQHTVIPTLVLEGEGRNTTISRVQQKKLDPHLHLTQTKDELDAGRIPDGVKRAQERIARLRINDRLRVKGFATGSLDIRGLVTYLNQLERLHKFVPDMVIIDYADLLAIDKHLYRISLGNLLKDFRGAAVERNFAAVTASQLNREGAGISYATEQHIAEDFSKVAVSDTVIIMNQLHQERNLGVCRLYVAASRNERDRFGVLVTQNYEIGQFAIASQREPGNYKQYLRQIVAEDRGADDAADEDVSPASPRGNGHDAEPLVDGGLAPPRQRAARRRSALPRR